MIRASVLSLLNNNNTRTIIKPNNQREREKSSTLLDDFEARLEQTRDYLLTLLQLETEQKRVDTVELGEIDRVEALYGRVGRGLEAFYRAHEQHKDLLFKSNAPID